MALDETQLEAFVHRFSSDVGVALQATTAVIGSRLGLYRALADLGPTDAARLSARTRYDRDFVERWLNTQYLSGYCEFSPHTSTYWLSPEQVEALTMLLGGPDLPIHHDHDHDHDHEHGHEHDRGHEGHGRLGIEYSDFTNPDEVRTPNHVMVEIVHVGGGEIGRYTLQPGWRWSDHVRPVVGGDSCQVDHIGYVVSGRLGLSHDDGSAAELMPGAVYRIRPGHDGWVLGDEPLVLVEFRGAATDAWP